MQKGPEETQGLFAFSIFFRQLSFVSEDRNCPRDVWVWPETGHPTAGR
jgi:hypothetical protein